MIKKKKDMDYIVKKDTDLTSFLLNIEGLSKNNIKSLLKYRQIAVDGRIAIRHDYPLKPNQKVTVIRSRSRDGKRAVLFKIIYEDDELLVIDKPAGLLSIATDKEKERTAYHLLTEYVKEKDERNRIFVVHRLDRDTSGVFVVAKNEKIKKLLQDNWSEIVQKRGYVAVVEGTLKKKEGTIRSWLKETKTHLVYSSFKEGSGDEAITDYKVLRSNRKYSLVDVDIKTGRKNQIRVHMRELGNPVVGDKMYGSGDNPIKRLALHASELELIHPITNKKYRFRSDIPKKFMELIK